MERQIADDFERSAAGTDDDAGAQFGYGDCPVAEDVTRLLT
jgi:hypothetical protein